MDRREFLKASSAAVAVTAIGVTTPLDAANKKEKRPSNWASETGEASERDLRARFLGTGAADWVAPDERNEYRRLTSLLLDSRILIDFTRTDIDFLPSDCIPEAVFYTHSHRDHYNAEDEIRYVKAPVVYVSDTWLYKAREDFRSAAVKTGSTAPKIIPLRIGERVTLGDITITPLPANHSTSDYNEDTLIYLIEKGSVRVLYATDTGGILSKAARIVGIDSHVDGRPITGLIMEATMGMDHDEDFRIFTHSSVGLVKRTTDVLLSNGRLTPPAGQPVYLTHMARTLHDTQARLDSDLPMPLRAAYDGLDVIFRPV